MRNRLPLAGIVIMGVAAVLFLGCFLAGTARAANNPYSLTVTPLVGGYFFEGNQQIANEVAYGIAVGYNHTAHWGVEASYLIVPNTETTNTNISGHFPGEADKLTVHVMRADILYHFFPDQRLVPYIAVGGGAMILKPVDRPNNVDLLVDYGAGLKFFVTNRIALRADVRHVLDFTYHDLHKSQDYYNQVAFTVGVTHQFDLPRRGMKEQKPVQAVTAPPPAVPVPTEAPLPAPAPEEPLTLTVTPEKPGLGTAATPAPTPAGTAILSGISIEKDSLEIVSTQPIVAYRTFTLSQPSRLVIDIDGAANGMGVNRIPVHRFGITSIRFGKHPDFLRIVLDAAQGKLLPYRIEETGKGLKIIMTNP